MLPARTPPASKLGCTIRVPHLMAGRVLRMINRVGQLLDDYPWPEGRNVVVVTPLVASALLVHALGAHRR